MNKIEIIRELEMDQIDDLESLINQLEDNINDLDDRMARFQKTQEEIDLNMFIHNYQRLQKRQVSMFGLSKKLLSKISLKIETAKAELYKLKEVDDE